MASPAITYSPPEGHTPVGSPAPSQILLHRVASPNHLVQHTYVDSPRSVPADYQQYSAPAEHFEYEHTPETYINDDPHIYDFGPNGALPVDHQFVQPQVSQADVNNLLFMVLSLTSILTIVSRCTSSTANSYARTVRKSYAANATDGSQFHDSLLRCWKRLWDGQSRYERKPPHRHLCFRIPDSNALHDSSSIASHARTNVL